MQLYGFSRSRRRFLLGFLLSRSRRGFGHRRGSRSRRLFGRRSFGSRLGPGRRSGSRRGLLYFRSRGRGGSRSRLRLLHRRHLRLFGCGSRFGLGGSSRRGSRRGRRLGARRHRRRLRRGRGGGDGCGDHGLGFYLGLRGGLRCRLDGASSRLRSRGPLRCDRLVQRDGRLLEHGLFHRLGAALFGYHLRTGVARRLDVKSPTAPGATTWCACRPEWGWEPTCSRTPQGSARRLPRREWSPSWWT